MVPLEKSGKVEKTRQVEDAVGSSQRSEVVSRDYLLMTLDKLRTSLEDTRLNTKPHTEGLKGVTETTPDVARPYLGLSVISASVRDIVPNVLHLFNCQGH